MAKIKLFILVIVFVITCIKTSNAYERNFSISKFPESIKILIDSKSTKSFIKNTTRAFFSTRDDTINFELNSWIKVDIEIDGINYLAHIKRHGGQKDHLDPPFSSLKVKLKKNYKGIREFILFLEGSRDFEKEIFWTTLMEDLGFPSPVSFLSNVEFLGEKRVFLFQEKIGKEFLENFGIGDLPIVEYDERQMWSNYQTKRKNHEKINWQNWTDGLVFFGKVENTRFIKNINAVKISQKAINQINYNFQSSENINVFDELNYNYAKHALYGNNRKFVYNPMYDILTPIYYDGGDWSFDRKNINCETDKFHIKTEKLVKNFQNKTGYELEKYLICTANDIFLKYNDLDWTDNRYKHLLNLQKKNFLTKNETKIILPDHCYGHLYIEKSKCIVEDNLESDFSKVFFQEGEDFFLCEFKKNDHYLNNCTKIDEFEIIKKIISGNRDPEKILTRNFNFKKGYYDSVENKYNLNIGIINLEENNQIKKIELPDIDNQNLNLITLNEDKTYILDLTNRKNQKNDFEVIFQNQNSRLIIIGDVKNSDNFRFKSELDMNVVESAFRYDENKLTGCVTFLDVDFNGGSIFSENMFCEDNINIIRGTGKIDNLKLNNSKFDALDLDFSKLDITSIKVNNSGNDCVDISYGIYNFDNVELDGCGDKGLSIGERSTAKVSNFNSKFTNIGVASKDSSSVLISKLDVLKTKFCLASYNKKPEFDGGEIKVDKFNCLKYFKTILKDKISKIYIKEKLIEASIIGDDYILDNIVIDKNINLIESFKASNDDGSYNAVIEISLGDIKKYEVSKVNGNLEQDFEYGIPRVIQYQPYPINYGIIPSTVLPLNKGGDGDPLDVIIFGEKIKKGEVIKFLPVGLIQMKDEGEKDDKVIGIRIKENEIMDINVVNFFSENSKKINEITNWFENYKGNGIVEILEYKDANEAESLIIKANKFYKNSGIKKF